MPRRGYRPAPLIAALLGLIVLIAAALAVVEAKTSFFQSRFFSSVGAKLKFEVAPGASDSIRFPPSGPYDQRLGYSELPGFIETLRANGYRISAQARLSRELVELIDSGYFAPYEEKSQTGLRVLDCRGETLFSASHPGHVYASFDAIPPLVVGTLLFIENRELLDADHATRNPALEWARLGKAITEQGIKKVFDSDYDAPGGSTLATQIEKYRHSPGGLTATFGDKFRQVVSASLRAYAQGPDTSARRRQIVLDYLNTVPLAAVPGRGEVNGLGDGLAAWYGADFEGVNALLRQPSGDSAAQALAYRQVLSLMIAQRRPSYFLGPGRPQLAALTDSYLRLLASAGIIPGDLRDAALQATVQFRDENGTPTSAPPPTWKAANLVRTRLATLLKTPRLYDTDRLDLTAGITLNAELQEKVTGILRRLGDAQYTKTAGLHEPQLLAGSDPRALLYSFTLYERAANANVVRVQTDNFSQPFDINEGARLELGSTAKLRALATYLALMASLHERYSATTPAELRRLEVHPRDRLTRWAVDYLAAAKTPALAPMLEAALERRYPASPAEQFFTGGGLHTFANFKREDDAKTPSVREALRDSVNLVFIRLMRDIVEHTMYRAPVTPARVLEDAKHPQRAAYLARFADHEGREFMRRFYRKYHGMSGDEALAALLHRVRPTPHRLAAIYRTLEPEAGPALFARFVKEHLPASRLDEEALLDLYERYSPARSSLPDRGYVARIHPLELWLVGYLRRHPQAQLGQILETSAAERQAVYGWLFKTHRKNAQDIRIRALLEMEAFEEIHHHWRSLGYPFGSLVPSYATAIGVSGDRPAALAELIGIILNDGTRYPTVRVEALAFAKATPYETTLEREPRAGEQVMKPEVAAALKRALTTVVEEGTARRLRGAFVLPDKTALTAGGKTGTGDNRFEIYGAGGKVLESRAVNRTATFAFFLGDRHFGVLTAYVPGAAADDYRFTSALPVQILKTMAPDLMPYLLPGSTAACAPR